MGLATTGIFPVFLAGALAVQMSNEFGYGAPGIGLSIAGFYAVSSLTSIALGRLADRVGWQRSIRLGALGCVLSLIAVGLLARSLVSVVLLIAAAGLSNALLQPAVNLLVATEAPFSRRGLLFGLKQAAIPFATLLGGIAVPVVALTVGWRWAYLGAACVGVLAVTLLPREGNDHNSIRSSKPALPLGQPIRSLRLFVLVSLFGQTGASVLGSFLVASAVHVGLREGDAGLLLAAASGVGIIARVLVGWWADHGLKLDLKPVAGLLTIGAVGFVFMAVPTTWTTIIGAIVGFAAAWGWPGFFNLIVIDRFAQVPATATSATQIGVYIGNGVGAVAFGVIAARSFVAAWLTSAAVLIIAASIAARAVFMERRVTMP